MFPSVHSMDGMCDKEDGNVESPWTPSQHKGYKHSTLQFPLELLRSTTQAEVLVVLTMPDAI